uniref:Hepatoma-derived growth factor-related protein 2-like n=1 Tax=Tanacetum cinerariifolium TaxID=118510 RepID=A0A699IS15_TANCI|nr:hepatoma-derived growth factor-related protein 2-like [Tanacetum cinerariifolium]
MCSYTKLCEICALIWVAAELGWQKLLLQMDFPQGSISRWFIEYFATIEDYGLMVYTLKSFSVKKRKKLMNKEMKEEDKLNKEADKIVKWAKQASNRRTNVSGLNLDEGLVI